MRRYFERGLLVTINTDDPKMFGNSLADEYRLLVEKLGFMPEEVRELVLNGVQAAWMPEEKKVGLAREILDFTGAEEVKPGLAERANRRAPHPKG